MALLAYSTASSNLLTLKHTSENKEYIFEEIPNGALMPSFKSWYIASSSLFKKTAEIIPR